MPVVTPRHVWTWQEGWRYWWSGCMAPHNLNFSRTWGWVASWTPRPLYNHRENNMSIE